MLNCFLQLLLFINVSHGMSIEYIMAFYILLEWSGHCRIVHNFFHLSFLRLFWSGCLMGSPLTSSQLLDYSHIYECDFSHQTPVRPIACQLRKCDSLDHSSLSLYVPSSSTSLRLVRFSRKNGILSNLIQRTDYIHIWASLLFESKHLLSSGLSTSFIA